MKELELILAAVTQLGEAGKEAFIWYLLLDKGLLFLGWIGTLISIVYSIAYMTRADIKKNRAITQLQTLRDKMQVGCVGELTTSEYNEMLSWVEQRK